MTVGMAPSVRRAASRQRTPLGSRHADHCFDAVEPEVSLEASECIAELSKVKSWMEQERAARGQLQNEQRQFLQELHSLAAAIEGRFAHVERQAASRCVELVGPAGQGAGLTRSEVEAVAERAIDRAVDRAADDAARRVEEGLRNLRREVDKWRQEHVVVMAEFMALQGKVMACGERAERACRVAAVWDAAVGSLRALVNGLEPALDSAGEQLRRIEELSAEVQSLQQERTQHQELEGKYVQLEHTLERLSSTLAVALTHSGNHRQGLRPCARQPPSPPRAAFSPRSSSVETQRAPSARALGRHSTLGPPLQPAVPPAMPGVGAMRGAGALQPQAPWRTHSDGGDFGGAFDAVIGAKAALAAWTAEAPAMGCAEAFANGRLGFETTPRQRTEARWGGPSERVAVHGRPENGSLRQAGPSSNSDRAV